MREKITVKQLGFAIAFLGLVSAQPAFSQTQVSASVNISGSCSSCDLSRRVMPNFTLQGSNFSGSDFSHSNLSGGKFHGSNLEGASFYKAFLMRAEGKGTNMRGAILRDTNLVGAKFINSDISRCDLRRADMSKGDFSESHFLVSNLTGVDAVSTNFKSANFAGSKLDHSDFTNADFTNAIFENVNFGNAVLKDAIFDNANLSGASLKNVSGLTQKQVDTACGNENTKLPAGIELQTCEQSRDHHMEIVLSSPLTWTSRIEQFALIDTNPNKAARPFPPLKSSLQSTLNQIENTLHTLPRKSPLRIKLLKLREQLEYMQSPPMVPAPPKP